MVLFQVVFGLWALMEPLGLKLMDFEIDEMDLLSKREVPLYWSLTLDFAHG